MKSRVFALVAWGLAALPSEARTASAAAAANAAAAATTHAVTRAAAGAVPAVLARHLAPVDAQSLARVGAGTYRPLFPPTPGEASIDVAAFAMQRTPVTSRAFLDFVRARPEWRRDRVARVQADEAYLSRWASPDTLGDGVAPNEPVVGVSWFAARAYCEANAMRLPTEAEWEHAAAASRTRPDGEADPSWRAELLAVYSRPGRVRDVGEGEPNFWGLYDLHGLVWEWVADFGTAASAFGDANASSFCGAVATGASASSAASFPAFERVAFRTSLRAAYTTRNLGFRCATSAREERSP